MLNSFIGFRSNQIVTNYSIQYKILNIRTTLVYTTCIHVFLYMFPMVLTLLTIILPSH